VPARRLVKATKGKRARRRRGGEWGARRRQLAGEVVAGWRRLM